MYVVFIIQFCFFKECPSNCMKITMESTPIQKRAESISLHSYKYLRDRQVGAYCPETA